MKFNSILTLVSLTSFVALVASLTLDFGALICFAVSAVSFVVLIGSTDYQRPRHAATVRVPLAQPRERMPLAA